MENARSEPTGTQAHRTSGAFDLVMNQHRQIETPRRLLLAVGLLIVMVGAGCARAPGAVSPGGNPGADGGVRSQRFLVNPGPLSDDSTEAEDYDPWQPFNERMFAFNHDILDRWLIKPVATAWSKISPERVRRSISHMFDNFDMPHRLVNNIFQARPVGAARELARFAVNTTVGVGGLFDVATALHIEPSEADAGQTLAVYGVGPGPFLVLPTFPPLTVRDAIGRGIDSAMDPISYVL